MSARKGLGIVGYVVVWPHGVAGQARWEERRTRYERPLFNMAIGTLFPTRRSAQLAARQSWRWWKTNCGSRRRLSEYQVVAVRRPLP